MFPPYLAGVEGAALISGAAGEHIISARRQLQQAETAPPRAKRQKGALVVQNTKHTPDLSTVAPPHSSISVASMHMSYSYLRSENSHTELYAHMHDL